MKTGKHILPFALFLGMTLSLHAGSPQTRSRQARDGQTSVHWQERIYMEYYVEEPGDTVFVDELAPAYVFPRLYTRRDQSPDMRKYYRLVYNFNRVWPYTPVARKVVHDADSTMASMNRLQKERYVDKVQKQLLDDFTDIAKHLTISQGKLLCRMVDREVGKSSYDIVKDYKSGVAAKFWQGVAKLFDQDLKARYDPQGEDRMTEYLIDKWETGQFEALYFSVFGKWPEKTVVPEKYR